MPHDRTYLPELDVPVLVEAVSGQNSNDEWSTMCHRFDVNLFVTLQCFPEITRPPPMTVMKRRKKDKRNRNTHPNFTKKLIRKAWRAATNNSYTEGLNNLPMFLLILCCFLIISKVQC